MTDPVNTGALRKIAAECNENNHNPDNGWLLGSAGDALDTAADEVDRLRAELAEGLVLTKQHAKDGARERRLLERDVHRLRAVIENAPHETGCMFPTSTYPTGKCTCWKAGVL